MVPDVKKTVYDKHAKMNQVTKMHRNKKNSRSSRRWTDFLKYFTTKSGMNSLFNHITMLFFEKKKVRTHQFSKKKKKKFRIKCPRNSFQAMLKKRQNQASRCQCFCFESRMELNGIDWNWSNVNFTWSWIENFWISLHCCQSFLLIFHCFSWKSLDSLRSPCVFFFMTSNCISFVCIYAWKILKWVNSRFQNCITRDFDEIKPVLRFSYYSKKRIAPVSDKMADNLKSKLYELKFRKNFESRFWKPHFKLKSRISPKKNTGHHMLSFYIYDKCFLSVEKRKFV